MLAFLPAPMRSYLKNVFPSCLRGSACFATFSGTGEDDREREEKCDEARARRRASSEAKPVRTKGWEKRTSSPPRRWSRIEKEISEELLKENCQIERRGGDEGNKHKYRDGLDRKKNGEKKLPSFNFCFY
jgi:hypothetical protein